MVILKQEDAVHCMLTMQEFSRPMAQSSFQEKIVFLFIKSLWIQKKRRMKKKIFVSGPMCKTIRSCYSCPHHKKIGENTENQ